jgi:RimJ/RimL family protein N-acetyltransferase
MKRLWVVQFGMSNELSPQKLLETGRLKLRWLNPGDAPFILRLLNDPSWLRHIGDKGVHTVDHAAKYIENGPVAMYRRFGFGLYLVQTRDGDEPIGVCGLIKRDTLDEVDLGFAFLPAFRGKGYAFESATAVMAYGRRTFGLPRLLAVTSPENETSAALLRKLGFRFERLARLSSEGEEVEIFSNP